MALSAKPKNRFCLMFAQGGAGQLPCQHNAHQVTAQRCDSRAFHRDVGAHGYTEIGGGQSGRVFFGAAPPNRHLLDGSIHRVFPARVILPLVNQNGFELSAGACGPVNAFQLIYISAQHSYPGKDDLATKAASGMHAGRLPAGCPK